MSTYTLASKDIETGADTVASIIRHCEPFGLNLISVHYEAGVWTVTTDKDFPEKQREHFERVDTQTVFSKAVK